MAQKRVLFLTVVSITFVITEGGAKIMKGATQNRKDKIARYLN